MDIEQLVSYIHQLQTENKELQKHIFNIQQQLNQKNQSIVLSTKKIDELNEYIQKCENQIIKRQQRQLANIQEIEELKNQIGVYLEQIASLKNIDKGWKEEKKEYKQDVVEVDKNFGNAVSARPAKMPPKAQGKCKNCEVLANDKQFLMVELQKQRDRCYIISRDLQCVVGTFCTS